MELAAQKDQVRFLYIGKGSIAESATQTCIATDIDCIDKGLGNEWVKTTDTLLAMLTRLQQAKQEQK